MVKHRLREARRLQDKPLSTEPLFLPNTVSVSLSPVMSRPTVTVKGEVLANDGN